MGAMGGDRVSWKRRCVNERGGRGRGRRRGNSIGIGVKGDVSPLRARMVFVRVVGGRRSERKGR